MKILGVLLFLPMVSFAQILERNEVDEFTGRAVRETSYEVLVRNMKMNAFVSGFRVDSVYWLRLKLMVGAAQVHAIDEGATFFLKLTSGDVIELKNSKFTVSCTGCGARGFSGSQGQGTQTTWWINQQQFERLLSGPVGKIRIYTTDGYIESDVKSDAAYSVMNCLRLLK